MKDREWFKSSYRETQVQRPDQERADVEKPPGITFNIDSRSGLGQIGEEA
jgi:hypothetical protein